MLICYSFLLFMSIHASLRSTGRPELTIISPRTIQSYGSSEQMIVIASPQCYDRYSIPVVTWSIKTWQPAHTDNYRGTSTPPSPVSSQLCAFYHPVLQWTRQALNGPCCSALTRQARKKQEDKTRPQLHHHEGRIWIEDEEVTSMEACEGDTARLREGV